jgi:hypothetical protein
MRLVQEFPERPSCTDLFQGEVVAYSRKVIVVRYIVTKSGLTSFLQASNARLVIIKKYQRALDVWYQGSPIGWTELTKVDKPVFSKVESVRTSLR